jgi:hypothetical protein
MTRYILFANPSFWGGTAQIMDLGNTMLVYNESATPAQADYVAIKNDWMIVGDDLRHAIRVLAADDRVESHHQ